MPKKYRSGDLFNETNFNAAAAALVLRNPVLNHTYITHILGWVTYERCRGPEGISGVWADAGGGNMEALQQIVPLISRLLLEYQTRFPQEVSLNRSWRVLLADTVAPRPSILAAPHTTPQPVYTPFVDIRPGAWVDIRL